METTLQAVTTMDQGSKAAERTGYVLSGVAVLFLLFDTVTKLAGIQAVSDSMTQLGYPVGFATTIGVIELLCLFPYLVPRTAIVGAILLTGYLGGAVATHVRIGSPLASHTLFPIYVAVLVWGGLYLRDARVRALAR